MATINVELPVCPCGSPRVKRQRTGGMIEPQMLVKNMLCLDCGQPFLLFVRFSIPNREPPPPAP
jgi:hypothetical protein